MIIGWSGDNGDPDNWLNVLFGCDSLSGNNFSKWCDKKFDGLVKEAKRTTDQGKRTELYKQAQHVLKDAVPMTPIAHSTVYPTHARQRAGLQDQPIRLELLLRRQRQQVRSLQRRRF